MNRILFTQNINYEVVVTRVVFDRFQLNRHIYGCSLGCIIEKAIEEKCLSNVVKLSLNSQKQPLTRA